MTSRSRRPQDPHNRHNTSSDQVAEPAKSRVWRAAMLLSVGMLGYGLLFFSTADRFEWLALPLVPDVLITQWFGGAGGSFAVLDRLPVAGGALAILALAFVWGALLLATLEAPRADRRSSGDRWERSMLNFACGLPLVSLATMLVGVAGWLRTPGLAGTAFAGVTCLLGIGCFARHRAALAVRATRTGNAIEDVTDDSQRATAPPEPPAAAVPDTSAWTPLEYALAIIAAGLSLFIIWGGILPPWEFDVREYHLQAPKEWWQAGRISFMPHNVYANMPLGAEMWALTAMVFWPGDEPWWWGALVGKTVIAAVAPLTSGLLIAIGNRLGSRQAGLVAAALYLATPWTAHVALSGLVDGVVGFYLAAACLAALGWFETSSAERNPAAPTSAWNVAALVGWLAGGAAACKYPGLVFAVVPLGLWMVLRHGWRRCNWREAAAFALAAIVVAGPWYVKNAWVAGNPTYPLLVNVWGGETRTEAKDRQWREAHRQRDAQGRTYSFSLLASGAARVGWRSEWLNPVVIPLGLAALILSWRRRPIQFLAAVAAWVLTVWWLAGHRIDRFWLPALPLLTMLAGLAPVAWPMVSTPWRRTALTFAGFGIVLGGLVSCSPKIGDVRLFVPLADLRDQVEHPLHRELDRLVPPGSRALLVGDAQPFDLRCSVLYSTCFDDSPLAELVASPRGEDRRAALAAARISHVLVDWNEIARYRQPGNYGYPEFVTRELFDELTRGQGVLRLLPGDPRAGELYEVLASPAPD